VSDSVRLEFMMLLFVLFALGVVFLPTRYALLCWFLSAHLDLSGSQWASASAIGWGNTVRVIGLPTVLLVRIGLRRCLNLSYPATSFRAFLLFTLYVGVASLWSSFPISALKQFGYLYGYVVGFLILRWAWDQGILTYRLMWYAVIGSMALGIFRLWLQGEHVERFSSFTSPQSYAEFLVAVLCILLYDPQLRATTKTIYGVVVVYLVLLSGSRIGLIGAIACILVFLLYMAIQVNRTARLISYVGLVVLTVVVMATSSIVASESVGWSFRALDLLGVVSGKYELSDIGTFAFRLGMWEAALTLYQHFETYEWIFGRGTSSSAEVALFFSERYDPLTIDANRVMHNEFLRAFYEWGFLGLVALVGFLMVLVWFGINLLRRGSYRRAFLLFSFLPMLYLSLLTENIIAAGGANGIAFLAVLALVADVESSHRHNHIQRKASLNAAVYSLRGKVWRK